MLIMSTLAMLLSMKLDEDDEVAMSEHSRYDGRVGGVGPNKCVL
jgi:hypothetical protein